MKPILTVFFSLFLATHLRADENTIRRTQETANGWLAFIDSGKYSESWDEAATIFKQRVTKKEWAETVYAVRSPLGKLVSREMKSADYTKTLPGAPDGEYVVAQFATSFENKKAAIETVVTMLDKDGQWRVSGYFVK